MHETIKISQGPNGNGYTASLHTGFGAQLASASARTEEGARERLLLAAFHERAECLLVAFTLRENAEQALRDAERKEERARAIQAAIEAAEA